MARPFRFTSPVVGVEVLLRPRLLELLIRRWGARVVVLTGGAGFGKTTLLAQAAEENALDPRGVDVWLTCEPSDASGATLTRDLARALDLEPAEDAVVTIADVAEGVWSRAPQEVALLLDDIHQIPAGSAGAAVLEELVAALPENGHVVVAGRGDPPVRLARLTAQGRVVRVEEDALRLTAEEVETLARRRKVDPSTLATLGGWPALVELAVAAGSATAVEFVWEEVLADLGPDGRRDFAAVVAVGGGDDEVASAAADRQVDLDALLGGVPLVARRAGGAAHPHALWAEVIDAELTDEERRGALRRAGVVLCDRGDHARAVELFAAAEDWLAMSGAIVDICTAGRTLWVDRLSDHWLALLPEEAGYTGERRLLEGLQGRVRRPRDPDVADLLRGAAADFRARGHTSGEVAALAHLGYHGWLAGDTATVTEALLRMVELEQIGSETAGQFRALGVALLAGDAGDDATAKALLEGIHRSSLNPEWRAAVSSLLAMTLTNLGLPDEAIGHADEASALPEIEGMRAHGPLTRWFAGRPEEMLGTLPLPGLDSLSAYDRLLASLGTALCLAHTGQLDEAEVMLERARPEIDSFPDPLVGQAADAVVSAAVLVGRGDEDEAAARLRGFLADHPLDAVPVERALRWWSALVYVLAPETREIFDAQPYGPAWADGREVARTLVELRGGGPVPSLSCPPGRVITSVPLPMAVELAVGLVHAGHDEGDRLLAWLVDLLGHGTRAALRSLADGPGPLARPAKRILAAMPVPPSAPLDLALLGPTELRRDGEVVDHPDWRRERVRSLLLYLVVHRRARREEVAAALWPDFDADAAARNLRTTLSYLQGVLEPERGGGEAPFIVRHDGASLTLHPEESLRVDVWEFERRLDDAAHDDAAGAVSVALDRLLGALDLWRGDYLADLPYDDWAATHRDRLRARYVAAGVRAGELLLAAGRTDRAAAIAERVLLAEPWSEAAYRVLVRAHLASGDRAGALRTVERCRAMIADLGVDPEPATSTAIREALAAR